MARKPRVDVEGGLYHVITRGNNRRRIFDAPDDYQKFLSLLEIQKNRLPFFLYAYRLMTNHVHLLIERQATKWGQACDIAIPGYSSFALNYQYNLASQLKVLAYPSQFGNTVTYTLPSIQFRMNHCPNRKDRRAHNGETFSHDTPCLS